MAGRLHRPSLKCLASSSLKRDALDTRGRNVREMGMNDVDIVSDNGRRSRLDLVWCNTGKGRPAPVVFARQSDDPVSGIADDG